MKECSLLNYTFAASRSVFVLRAVIFDARPPLAFKTCTNASIDCICGCVGCGQVPRRRDNAGASELCPMELYALQAHSSDSEDDEAAGAAQLDGTPGLPQESDLPASVDPQKK